VRAEFIGKDRALAELVADLPSLSVAADLVDNPLPDTLRMRLLDPGQTSIVRVRLEQLPGVDGVEDGSDAVNTFLAVSEALRVVGVILIVVLLSRRSSRSSTRSAPPSPPARTRSRCSGSSAPPAASSARRS
jgi:cell division protein FtsX